MSIDQNLKVKMKRYIDSTLVKLVTYRPEQLVLTIVFNVATTNAIIIVSFVTMLPTCLSEIIWEKDYFNNTCNFRT